MKISKIITPDEIMTLVEKLNSGQDITQDEASSIKKLFTGKILKTKLNDHSSKFDFQLEDALSKWFVAVKDALYAGKKGNFANTICLYFDPYAPIFFHHEIFPFLRKLAAKKKEEIIKIAYMVYFPQKIGEAIAKRSSTKFVFYNADRKAFSDKPTTAGMYGFQFDFYDDIGRSDIYPFAKEYVPIISPELEDFDEPFYANIVKAKGSPYYPVDEQNIKKYIIAEAIRSSGMETILLKLRSSGVEKALLKLGIEAQRKDYDFGNAILCARGKDVPLILSWAEVPIEDIISKLLLSGKITHKEIDSLMDKKESCFLKRGAISEGAEIIKKLAGERKEIEEGDSWTDEIR